MKYINTIKDNFPVSQIALGCMRMGNLNDKEADTYLNTAVECGYNYFDHADIYGGGKCEEIFGSALKRNPSLRDKIIIQTKCAIKKGMYDFSKKHILESVDGSLKRLGIEKIDVLLLHRPDLLMDPNEVAEAFDILQNSGKVDFFGVSNHSAYQIELLQRTVRQKLLINQLQLSLVDAKMISGGANVNVDNSDGINRDGYLRDYCRLNGITVQPWSPLQCRAKRTTFIGNEDFPELNDKLKELAEKYGVSETAIAIAWILRLPEKMQPIVGSVNPDRLIEISKATDICLSAEDWYSLYCSAGYCLP